MVPKSKGKLRNHFQRGNNGSRTKDKNIHRMGDKRNFQEKNILSNMSAIDALTLRTTYHISFPAILTCVGGGGGGERERCEGS